MEGFSFKTIQVTDLRQDIDGALQHTSKKELLKILRRGHEIGILMRPETYEQLENVLKTLGDRLEGFEETLAILSDRKLMRSLKKSLNQAKQGKVKSWEEVFGEPL